MKNTSIKDYVKKLLNIVNRMQQDYPKKRFTLDGRLVGDIGEILAEQIYNLELLEGQNKKHDAKSPIGLVQIKTTMKNTLTFGDIPEYYLGLKVSEDGNVTEIFNGPGHIIWDAIKHRRRPRNYLYSIGLSTFEQLSKKIQEKDKIQKR